MRSIAKPSRSHGSHRHRLVSGHAGAGGLLAISLLLGLGGCTTEDELDGEAWAGNVEADQEQLDQLDVEPIDDEGTEVDPVAQVSCNPRMNTFPVAAPHNIGYDHASCGTGTCQVSCPDAHANSDWGGAHHGIDVFAHHRADLVAVADAVVVRVGVVSNTSGIRVRLRDACGWEYYYGHLDQATVSEGQSVSAGDRIGYMGATGTGSTHLHFNVSPDGAYNNDINPFGLLQQTSPTACGAAPPPVEPPPPPPPPPPPAEGCGVMVPNQALSPGQSIRSCDGRFDLVMQGDGNLVLYMAGAGALWHTSTHGTSANNLVMQGDGNLVLYGSNGTALWHTFTYGNPGSHLAVQDDGNVVVYSGSTPLWDSGTWGH